MSTPTFLETPVRPSVPELVALRALVGADLDAVDETIRTRLRSDVLLIEDVGRYIVESGGKRLRPLLVLLAARAMRYTGTEHIALAAVIEFIHTATLLHDDVVDASDLRRGRRTVNARFGNPASVLVGDFLYTRAFEMMVEAGDMRIMQIMARCTNRIAEGEVMQLAYQHDMDTTEARYLEVISRKTAQLFEAGAELAAVLTQQPDSAATLARYGWHLGMAFQLIDDALDYQAAPEQLGKNPGDDFAEGKPTLPLIVALRVGTPEQRSVLQRALSTGGREQMAWICRAIESTGAIAYTRALARQHAEAAQGALCGLPDTVYLDALHTLADFAVSRHF